MSYLYLNWIVDNFLFIFIAYFAVRAILKIRGIAKLSDKGGLKIGKFIRGRGGIGLVIGLAGLAITVAALLMPWYTVTAGSGTEKLITMDGTTGLNFSLPPGTAGTPLPVTNTVSVHILLLMIFAVGIPLLLIDVIGVTRGGRLGRKFIDGAVALILWVLLIYAFVSFFPSVVPQLVILFDGHTVSPQGNDLLQAIAGSAFGGSMQVGGQTVTWGFGIGTYLFLIAAVLRIVAGAVMSGVGDLAEPVAAPTVASGPEPTRRLAAIMFTDIVGYTALTQTNESKAMKLLEKHRKLIRPIFPKHSGREVKTIGDAFLVEFHSALEATECAIEMQKVLHDYEEPTSEKVKLKIGIHVGDVIHKDGDVYGDAVNIASRIEPLATGGGICISEQVFDQIRNKITYKMVKLEPKELKNVSFQIDTYRIELPWESPAPATEQPK